MQTVSIVGVGLIGGSFALALRKAGFRGRILGVSSQRTLEVALSLGVIDNGMPLAEAVPESDLVFLSQPIARIIQTIGLLDGHVRPGSLVTDAGSTKAAIAHAASSLRRCQFMGGHPMAGKETRGVEEAEADLFVGRTWVLTPSMPAELETAAAQEFLWWICRIGASPVTLDPQEHDRIVACTSHLPQLASTALAATLAGSITGPDVLRIAGPGLADTTRLALSPYEIWRDVLETNRQPIEEALDGFIARLQNLRTQLCSPATEAEFERAAEFGRMLRSRNG